MNQTATSKEELLEAARQIVFTKGADKLSIRELAQVCGISVGCVYNYFPSKAELVFQVVENFWRNVFHSENVFPDEIRYAEFAAGIYLKLYEHLEDFRFTFISQLEILSQTEKRKGKELERGWKEHIRRGFLSALERDKEIKPDVWTNSFTKEKFAEITIELIFSMLAKEEQDAMFLVELLSRILYEREGEKG